MAATASTGTGLNGGKRAECKLAEGVLVTILLLGLVAGAPSSLYAQSSGENTVRRAGATVNLFQTLDPASPIDALRVEVPDEWGVDSVHLFRYGTAPVPVTTRSDSAGRILVRMQAPLRVPHELVVRVDLPDQSGTEHWSIQSLARVRAPAGTARVHLEEKGQPSREVVTVEGEPVADGPNEVVSLAEAATPVRIRPEPLPVLGRGHSFTVEFWLQTNGLGEVVLSTWDGDESTAYPVEFVVDRAGRLRFYSGTAAEYRALRSGAPVADGIWHHVAAVYDADAEKLRLYMDGRVVDSLRGHPASPSVPLAMAVGGRVGADASGSTAPLSVFSGQLDEVRVWGRARTAAALRRTRSRSVWSGDTAPEQGVRVGFDADEDPALQDVPPGARRLPSTLSFQSRLRHLQASSTGGAVTLRWGAGSTNVDTFFVERSLNGTTFTTVATRTPSDVRGGARRKAAEYTYTDEEVQGRVVYYRIRQHRVDGSTRTSGTIKVGLGRSDPAQNAVELIGNFPNPFTEATTIAYEVREARPITITVWDVTGQRIAKLAQGMRQPGYHETAFNADNLPSGTYFLRLRVDNRTQSHRMVVLK